MIRSFVLLSFMMSASVAVAQTPDDSAGAPAAKPAKERKICRESDDSTSRLAKRICRTAKQWEESRSTGPKAGVRRVENND